MYSQPSADSPVKCNHAAYKFTRTSPSSVLGDKLTQDVLYWSCVGPALQQVGSMCPISLSLMLLDKSYTWISLWLRSWFAPRELTRNLTTDMFPRIAAWCRPVILYASFASTFAPHCNQIMLINIKTFNNICLHKKFYKKMCSLIFEMLIFSQNN